MILVDITVNVLEGFIDILPVILISVNITAGLEHILLPWGNVPSHTYNVQLLPGGISLKHLVKISWLLRERSSLSKKIYDHTVNVDVLHLLYFH